MVLQTLAVNWQSIGLGLLVVLFLAVSVVLILTVLIQKPQGGGLAGAFGSGAGSGQTAFGAKTGDALTWATIIMFVVWLIGSIGLNLFIRQPDLPVAIEATSTEVPMPIDTPAGAPQGAAPATPAAVPEQPATPAEPAPEPAPEPSTQPEQPED